MAFEDIGIRVLVIGMGEFRRAVGTMKGDIASVEATTRSVSGTLQGFGTTLTQIGGAMMSVGRTMTLAVTAPLGILSGVLINAGAQFQDTFQGIARTESGVAVGFDEIASAAKTQLGITVTTMDQATDAASRLGMRFGDLTPVGEEIRSQFRNMALEVPIATDKLTDLGTTLATLGVSTPDIVEVTRLVAMLGAAVDISAEEAATSLTKMFNILHTEGETLPDFINRAGSAIVALGNQSVATNADILNLAMRLSSAGDRAKFTTPQILAWATTISDVGARSEAGGSAVSRAINEMLMAVQTGGDNLGTFAKVAGVSVDKFSDMFKKDASNAMMVFIDALNKGIATGKINKDMLNDMGLGGIRAVDILGRLSNATDDFRKNLGVANDGWDRQIALQDAANKRWNTVSSMIQILKNDFTDLGISIFDLVKDDIQVLITNIKTVVDWFKSLDDNTKKTILKFALIAAAVGPLLILLGGLVSVFGTLVTVVGALVSPIGLVVLGIGLLIAAVGSLVGWDNIFRAGEKALKDAQPLLDTFVASLGMIPKDVSTNVNFKIAPALQNTANAGPPGGRFANTSGAEGASTAEASPAPAIKTLGDTIQEFMAKNKDFLLFFAGIQTVLAVAGTAFQSFVSIITTTAGPQIQGAIDNLTKTLAGMGLTWGDVWNALKTGIAVVAQIIGAIILGVIGLVVGLITGAAAGINAFTGFILSLVGPFQTMLSGIQNIAIGFIGFFKSLFEGDLPGALGFLNTFAKGVGEALSGLWETIKAGVVGFVNVVYQTLKGFVDGVAGFFTDLYNRLIGHSIVPDIINGITDLFKNLVTQGPKIFQDMVDGILGVVQTLVTKTGEIVGQIAGTIAGALTGQGGEGAAASPVSADQIVAMQTAIIAMQTSWTALMATMNLDISTFFMNVNLGFIALPILVQETFALIALAVSMFVMTALEQFAVLQTSVVTAFTIMGEAGVSAFALGATGALVVMIAGMLLQFAVLDEYWRQTCQHMVGHWLAFVAQSNALTAEFVSATIREFDTLHTDSVGQIHALQADFSVALSGMQSSVNSQLVPAIGQASGAFGSLGKAAEKAVGEAVKELDRLCDAAKAAKACITASPTLAIQHPFERFEKYMKATDFGGLVEKQMTMPSFMTNVQAVTPASTIGNGQSVDKSVNVGDIYGAPINTKDDLTDVLLRYTHTREVLG
jgi:TP901 family phage tail tape measure protein